RRVPVGDLWLRRPRLGGRRGLLWGAALPRRESFPARQGRPRGRQHEATPITQHKITGRAEGSLGRLGPRGFNRLLRVAVAQQPAQVAAGELGAAQGVDLDGEVPDVALEFLGQCGSFEKEGETRLVRSKHTRYCWDRSNTVGVAHQRFPRSDEGENNSCWGKPRRRECRAPPKIAGSPRTEP